MKHLAVALLSLWLVGCASLPPMPPPAALFHDDAFAPAAVAIAPDAALALSPAMREYLAGRFVNRFHSGDKRRQLVNALYRGDLRLEYDAAYTRTAAEAFEARSGNCLALVLMTAAFAKELGLRVNYQSVIGEQAWDRAADLYIAIGHVNLVLEEPAEPSGFIATTSTAMLVDFLPPRDARLLRTRVIDEKAVIAMYLNNRAVEALTQGRTDEAYWWARAALVRDPEQLESYVTLGVVYRAGGQAAWADEALQRVLAREPEHLIALSNRVVVLRDLKRSAEADGLAERLAALDPHPPFSYFSAGREAFDAKRFDVARRLFAKEVERAPYHHEFEYWLAASYAALGDGERAQQHLQRAMEVSTTRKDHALYEAKLDRLRALRIQ